eukprot:901412-Pleurochrysis_carterae.AAC.1
MQSALGSHSAHARLQQRARRMLLGLHLTISLVLQPGMLDLAHRLELALREVPDQPLLPICGDGGGRAARANFARKRPLLARRRRTRGVGGGRRRAAVIEDVLLDPWVVARSDETGGAGDGLLKRPG